MKEEKRRQRSKECNIRKSFKIEIASNPVPYEDPKNAVSISIDDAGAKKQKAKREKPGKSVGAFQKAMLKNKRQYVQNTVVHIEKKDKSYVLNGCGVSRVLKFLIGFLLYNGLWGDTPVFFIDGHSLFSQIIRFFPGYDGIIIILDWYHLKKKCTELLSMALNGKKFAMKRLKN